MSSAGNDKIAYLLKMHNKVNSEKLVSTIKVINYKLSSCTVIYAVIVYNK